MSTSETVINQLEHALFGRDLDSLQKILAYDDRLSKLWRLIEVQYSSLDFNLQAASRQCGMSRNNLNRLLRRVTEGFTYTELLTAYRVYRSVRLALGANMSFTEIALQCGFEGSSGYSRTVKRLLSIPPGKLLPRGKNYRRELSLPPRMAVSPTLSLPQKS